MLHDSGKVWTSRIGSLCASVLILALMGSGAQGAGPEGASALSSAIRDLGGTLESAFTAAVITGIIVYCGVELIKLPLRGVFNTLVLGAWGMRREAQILKGPDQPPLPKADRPWVSVLAPRRSRYLPTDLLMKHLENRARAAMDPGADQDELRLFAAGTAWSDITRVSSATRRGGLLPSGASSEDETRADAELAAAQGNVAAAIERNLDELQITMSFWWPYMVQCTALVLSIVIVLSFAATVDGLDRGRLLLLLIAIAGAYLASIFRDGVGILQRMAGR